MQPERHLLVPTDGSRSSNRAVEYAIELAEILDASITLFHVLDEGGFDDDLIEAKKMMSEARDRISEKKISVSIKIKRGEPWKEIVKEAGQGYNMVIIGSKGLSGLKRILLGSVTENVARRSPCPVTIVR
jgi:nucleotide-binding universal stress UspA family protein